MYFKRVIGLPFGFFGSGNIGDELVLEGFLQLYPDIQINCANSVHINRVFPQIKTPISKCNIYAIVGDTPITDIQGDWPLDEVVRLSGIYQPMYCIGIGTEPLSQNISRHRIIALAQLIKGWTVRSNLDKQRLTNYGVPDSHIKVAADLAWLVSPAKPGIVPENWHDAVGINLTNEPWVMNTTIYNTMRDFIKWMIGWGHKVLLINQEVRSVAPFDNTIHNKLIVEIKSDKLYMVPNKYYSPQEFLSIIACCKNTVGMRYHFCLASYLQKVPTIIIHRQPKLLDLAIDTNHRKSLQFSLKELSLTNLQNALIEMARSKQELIDQMSVISNKMCSRAKENKL